MDKAETAAKLALALPEKPTSADVLNTLMDAYEAGERHGYQRGIIEGQTHTARAVGLVIDTMLKT